MMANRFATLTTTLAMVLGCVAALVGCGGGSGALAAAIVSFAVNGVVTGLATNGGTFSGSRTDAEGNVYKLNVTYAPDGAGWFLRSETLITNGVSGVTRVSRLHFSQTAALLQITGWTDTLHGIANILASSPLPTMANIGSSGGWFTGSVSGMNQETLFLTYAWSLDAVSESSAELCLRMGYLSGLTGFSDTDCFRIDASGTILAFKAIKDFRKSTFSSQQVYQ